LISRILIKYNETAVSYDGCFFYWKDFKQGFKGNHTNKIIFYFRLAEPFSKNRIRFEKQNRFLQNT